MINRFIFYLRGMSNLYTAYQVSLVIGIIVQLFYFKRLTRTAKLILILIAYTFVHERVIRITHNAELNIVLYWIYAICSSFLYGVILERLISAQSAKTLAKVLSVIIVLTGIIFGAASSFGAFPSHYLILSQTIITIICMYNLSIHATYEAKIPISKNPKFMITLLIFFFTCITFTHITILSTFIKYNIPKQLSHNIHTVVNCIYYPLLAYQSIRLHKPLSHEPT